MRLVVGLGNPGSRYRGTRHNVGFRVLRELCSRWGVDTQRRAFGGTVYEARPARSGGPPERVTMLAPETYMNRSGQAVQQMRAFYKAEPADLLIVLDDYALPLGRLRFRAQGSAGGHNGLADVLGRLGTDEVPRLRIGIGSPRPGQDAIGFVLSRFGPEEEPEIEAAVRQAAQAVEDWTFEGITPVMNRYNASP